MATFNPILISTSSDQSYFSSNNNLTTSNAEYQETQLAKEAPGNQKAMPATFNPILSAANSDTTFTVADPPVDIDPDDTLAISGHHVYSQAPVSELHLDDDL